MRRKKQPWIYGKVFRKKTGMRTNPFRKPIRRHPDSTDTDPLIKPFSPGVRYSTIPNFPRYRLGSDGSVWSPLNTWENQDTTRIWQRRLPNKDGAFDFTTNRQTLRIRVARLVLWIFSSGYQPGMYAKNQDNDPTNNDIANLRWEWPEAISTGIRQRMLKKRRQLSHRAS